MSSSETYLISASHPDDTAYQTEVDQALHSTQPSVAVAQGEAQRDAIVQAIADHGLTAHVRPA